MLIILHVQLNKSLPKRTQKPNCKYGARVAQSVAIVSVLCVVLLCCYHTHPHVYMFCCGWCTATCANKMFISHDVRTRNIGNGLTGGGPKRAEILTSTREHQASEHSYTVHFAYNNLKGHMLFNETAH